MEKSNTMKKGMGIARDASKSTSVSTRAGSKASVQSSLEDSVEPEESRTVRDEDAEAAEGAVSACPSPSEEGSESDFLDYSEPQRIALPGGLVYEGCLSEAPVAFVDASTRRSTGAGDDSEAEEEDSAREHHEPLPHGRGRLFFATKFHVDPVLASESSVLQNDHADPGTVFPCEYLEYIEGDWHDGTLAEGRWFAARTGSKQRAGAASAGADLVDKETAEEKQQEWGASANPDASAAHADLRGANAASQVRYTQLGGAGCSCSSREPLTDDQHQLSEFGECDTEQIGSVHDGRLAMTDGGELLFFCHGQVKSLGGNVIDEGVFCNGALNGRGLRTQMCKTNEGKTSSVVKKKILSVYQGDFENNQSHGQGKLGCLVDHEVFEGRFERGEFVGNE